jgi:protein gp37
MQEMTTGIDYGGEAWNVVVGCNKVSQGCVNCWAQGMAKRLAAMGREEYQAVTDERGYWNGHTVFQADKLLQPLKWKKSREVLVSFMGDLFHPTVAAENIRQVFDVIAATPSHTYYILTKRPERMTDILALRDALPNVLLGVSVEEQRAADERLWGMRYLSKAGWRTWASYEPALEAVDWFGWEFLNWLVCGGESGTNARMMLPRCARSARDFCVRNEIPFFFKQWGAWAPLDHLAWITDETTLKYKPVEVAGSVMLHVGKDKAGHVLDGREWREEPRCHN